MNRVRLMFSTLLVGLVVTTSSCGNDPLTAVPPPKALEPEPAPALSVIGGWMALIDSCSSLPAVSVQQTIGKAGGTIVAGPDTLRIPASALSKPVTITASLPDGYFVNIVKFQPDGLRFRKAATLSMGYSNCNVLAFLNLGIARRALAHDDAERLPSAIEQGRYEVGAFDQGTAFHLAKACVPRELRPALYPRVVA